MILLHGTINLNYDYNTQQPTHYLLPHSLLYLKLHSSHPPTGQKNVSLVDRPVGLQEIRLEVDIEEITSDALYSVIYWQNVDPLAILHIRECCHTVK